MERLEPLIITRIEAEAQFGYEIQDFLYVAYLKAREFGCEVVFEFNGVMVRVRCDKVKGTNPSS